MTLALVGQLSCGVGDLDPRVALDGDSDGTCSRKIAYFHPALAYVRMRKRQIVTFEIEPTAKRRYTYRMFRILVRLQLRVTENYSKHFPYPYGPGDFHSRSPRSL